MSDAVQQIAQSKSLVGVGVGGATAKSWVDYVINDPSFQATIILVGLVLSLTIITVHGFALWDRWKNR